ncbi:MAG: hypothetical protein EHM34_03880 [Nitrosopumilales archaeon]|nr:MAG: hypothetical protein EHM34_03880 [Nitrosopumilales archaeon]
MEKLKDIIRNNKMSTRPEFYSGRGAILCDLTGEILEGIFKGIEKEFGKIAAKNYVKMVHDIKVLSATTFLEELYQLFYNNWKYRKKKKHADGITIPKNAKGEYDERSAVSGMMGIFSAMSNGDRDETRMIKGHFLERHGIKPKRLMLRDSYTCYWEY